MPEFSDLRPRLSSSVAQSVADQAGGVAYGGAVEGSTNVAFGGPTADFILYGVVNGSLSQGPADPNGFIDPQNNPLPYWSGPTPVTPTLAGLNVAWMADATTPSGYKLRFTSASSYEAYFEQVVPIAGSRAAIVSHNLRVGYVYTAGPLPEDYAWSLRLTYLDSTGAALVGSDVSASSIDNTSNIKSLPTPVSIDTTVLGNAAFLRIRVGVLVNVANGGYLDITDVRLDQGHQRLMMADTFSALAYYPPGYLQQDAGSIGIYPSGAVVVPVSVSTTAARFRGIPVEISEQAAPATPSSGYHRVYAKTDSLLYAKDDGGTEYNLETHASGALTPATVATTGSLTGGAAVIHSGLITDSFGVNKNNYAPANFATGSMLQFTVSAASTITGFSATNCTEGQMWTCTQGGGFNLTLAHASTSSTSGNRISSANSADLVIRSGGGFIVQYMPSFSAANPFRIIASNG